MMRIIEKKAIIFDWDGTLFDSMKYKRENIVKIFIELGGSEIEVIKLHEKFSGLPRKELFTKLFNAIFRKAPSENEYNRLSNEYTKLNIQSSLKAKLFYDVEPVIKKLHKQCLLFISSSSDPEELQEIVQRQSVYTFFTGIYGSNPGFSKGRAHFDYIISNWSLKEKDLLFIGDDEQDLGIGIKSGIDVIRINRNNNCLNNISSQNISSLSVLLNYL